MAARSGRDRSHGDEFAIGSYVSKIPCCSEYKYRCAPEKPGIAGTELVAWTPSWIVHSDPHLGASAVAGGRRCPMLGSLANMVRSFFVLAAVVAAMIPSVAQAQVSLWLQEGVSGYGVGAGILGTDNTTTLIGQGGYSYRGFLELNVGVGWDHFEEDGLELDGLVATTLVQFHPLKQTKEIPVSLEIGAIYRYSQVLNEDLDALGVSLTGQSFSLLGGAYRFVPLGKQVGVTPEVLLSWVHNRTTVSDDGFDQTTTEDDFRVVFGTNFGYLDNAGHIWGLTPTLSVGTGPAIFGLFLTFIGVKQ
jgi:hypothetical protein